jgi:hypothetical protein
MSRDRLILILILAGIVISAGVVFKQPPRWLKAGPEYLSALLQVVVNPEKNAGDGGIQPSLALPPEEIKAVYCTSWCAGSAIRVNYLINLIRETELNAVVIDIKDYSGYVAYDIRNDEVARYGAKQIRIPRINSLIKKFHDEGIYVIARQTVFQDPILAAARPDWAIKNSKGELWKDNLKLAWVDPASSGVWDYNIAIAKDALARGFDEVNFDYVRFPSDGNLRDMVFPVYDGKTTRQEVLADFFKKLRQETEGKKISADLFGLTTINYDDLGVGQVIESAFLNFDYVSPMVYPSHYAAGFLGHQNPAEFPAEVVQYSVTSAISRRNILVQQEREEEIAALRPWLQDFDLGAKYDEAMVRSEIDAVEQNGGRGWLLWNPSNWYTKEALKPAELTVRQNDLTL